MRPAAVASHQIRLPLSHLVVIACYADDLTTLVDYLNAPKPGTSLELLDLETTSTGAPVGGHLVVLRSELPAWEAAGREHGVRLVVTDAPVRLGLWPGDAVVRPDGPHDVIIEIPR